MGHVPDNKLIGLDTDGPVGPTALSPSYS